MKDKVWSFGNRVFQFLTFDVIFAIVVGLVITSELFAIGSLSYLGTFSRHLADDYCESVSVRNEPVLSAVFHRFVNGGSNRYSNLLFVGLSEILGEYSIQILPSLMLFVWLIGMIWLIRQLRTLAEIRWPVILDYLLAISVIFFSAWQAPNRFQIFFWRSGMATHFAPLVFITLLYGFILFRINFATKPSPWLSMFVLLSSFIVGGFSEPPTTFLIAMMIVLIPVVYRWENDVKRQPALNLLVSSLAGVVLAFVAMFFSPSNPSRGNASFTYLLVTIEQTFQFTFDFINDTLKTQPLPSFVSFLISFFVFFAFFIKSKNQPLSRRFKRQAGIVLVLVPLVHYLFIAASFAPSAFGEAYPAERAQFLGRLIMTATLILDGALLGVLCGHSQLLSPWRGAAFLFSGFAIIVMAFYPLRAGIILLADVPNYRRWTSVWDFRETEIYNSIAMGEKDLVVRWLPTKEGVKEIDGETHHWVNRCAAEYYQVNSIRSVPMNK